MAEPTAYPDLNEVLRELVSSVQRILGQNFCGAYLQGSFAVGDADEHSDVDFIVVTHEEVGDDEVAELQAMCRSGSSSRHTLAQPPPGARTSRKSSLSRPARRSSTSTMARSKPVRDNHCNTAVVRWSVPRGCPGRPDPEEPHRPCFPG